MNSDARYVYEAVDHTDDEAYYAIGVWETLEAAVAAIESADLADIDEYGQREFGQFEVRIRRRLLNGIQTANNYVYVIEFSEFYDDEAGGYYWKVTHQEGLRYERG